MNPSLRCRTLLRGHKNLGLLCAITFVRSMSNATQGDEYLNIAK